MRCEVQAQRSAEPHWRVYLHPVARVAWLVLLCCAVSPALGFQSLPNIIVIVTDDQGLEAISGQNWFHPDGFDMACHTPTLSLLSDQGVVFTNCRTNPYCSPTRVGLMTGRHPCTTGVAHVVNSRKSPMWVRDRVGMQTYEHTMPELLRDSGYRTILIDKWHSGEASVPRPIDAPSYVGYQEPNDQGFTEPYDTYEDNWCIEKWAGDVYCGFPFPQCSCGDPACDDAHNWTTDTDRITGSAEEAVAAVQNGAGPYALFYHTMDPHARARDCNERHWWRVNFDLLSDPFLYYDENDPFFETDRNRYRAVIEGIDTTIGAMLTDLGVIDLQGNYIESSDTIVFFLSDNGTPSFATEGYEGPEYAVSMYSNLPNEYTYRGHAKGTVYEGGIRVPLLVFGEGISDTGGIGPIVVDRLTSYVDLYDTIADIVDATGGVPSERGPLPRAGRSFAYYLGYSDTRDDHEITVSGLTIRRQVQNRPEEIHRVAVTDGQYKLVIDTTAADYRPLQDGAKTPRLVEFYDLLADPEEVNDLADGSVPTAFYRMWDRVVDQWPTAVPEVDPEGRKWIEVGIPVDGVFALNAANEVTASGGALPLGFDIDGTESRVFVKFKIAALYAQLRQSGMSLADITSAQVIFRIQSDSSDVWLESWDETSSPPPYATRDSDTGPVRAYPMMIDPFLARNIRWNKLERGHHSEAQVGLVDLPPHLLYSAYTKLGEHGFYDPRDQSLSALSGPQYPPGTPVSMGRSTTLITALHEWMVTGENFGIVLKADPLDFDGDKKTDGDQRVFLQMDDLDDIRIRLSFVN
ncbi:MAG: hypothetical protein D8M59_02070 [Planctomycetes bacterium]|nr:hypothetical protein [Planctomycetota bacterium]NOG54492.1 sulfatase-like hydrolase/transferase [Planctomycetota bacterium]